jgi:glycine/D-amino acid oxidase-like deaminating enzyme
LLVAPHKGLFLARDDEHADEVAVRLASAHIAYFTECTSWGRPGFVVIDAAVDTRLMVAKLLDDCRDVGATIVAGAIEHPPASDGGKWVIDTTYGRFRAGQVVLGLGAAMHKYLHAWRLDVGAPEYRATRTQVLVVPEAPMRTAMIPLFDAGPTLVPVWHEGRHHGVTVCLPFDNDDDPTHPARQSTAELLDQCVDRLPELARWLTRSVRESAWTYSCQKLLIAGQSDGTEASRTYRIDRLTDNLTAIYAGKLTTASTAARALLEELPLPNCPRARQPGELLGQPVVAPRAAVSRAFADQI